MRSVAVVLLLLSLAGCVNRGTAEPTTTSTATSTATSTTTTTTATTTTTTFARPDPADVAKRSETITSGLVVVRTWLTTCAPGLPRAPGCEWANVVPVVRNVLAEVEVIAGAGPRPPEYNRLREAAMAARGAFGDFGDSACPEWLVSRSGDVMTKLNCANMWEWLPDTWTELEGAVAS